MNDKTTPPSTDAARQTFSEKSDQYAVARPQYPDELFAWLANNCSQRDTAWDCATGNGQAAVGLAPYFGKVIATDISAEQIAHGIPRANITYAVGGAEVTGFADQSIDLIAVAQALHWFDYSRFWPEVQRIAREGALFCAWGYDWMTTTEEVSREVVTPFRDIIAPFWASNNKLLWDGYQSHDIAFPVDRIPVPRFSIELQWTLPQLLSYMMTWSAYKRCHANTDAAVVIDRLIQKSLRLVGPEVMLPISMTLKTVAGHISHRKEIHP